MGSTVFNKYPSTCTFEGKQVLNIGCGFAKYPAKNVVNLDAEAWSEADVTWDLGNPAPLPFADGTFDFIIANHILEHVPNWWHCFEECARILKVGGHMEIWVPAPGNDSVLGFRDHINTINTCSFWGTYDLSRNPNNAWASANSSGPAASMKMLQVVYSIEKGTWGNRLPKWLQAWCLTHLRNFAFEIGFKFVKMPPRADISLLSQASVEGL